MVKVKKILTYLVIMFIAVICALNYELFIFPNRFAPAGLNGICTMIQYIFGINIGYMSMIINVPLALIVYFLVSKPLAIRSMVYVGTFCPVSFTTRKTEPVPSSVLWWRASSSAAAMRCCCRPAPTPAARISSRPSSISTIRRKVFSI